MDDIGNRFHVSRAQAALAHPRCAKADAGRERRLGVAGDRILVDDDARQVEDARGHFSTKWRIGRHLAAQRKAGAGFARLGCTHVQHDDVSVGAAIRHAQPTRFERIRKRARVFHREPLKLLELLRPRQLEGHAHGRKLVDVRPALRAGENRHVNLVRLVLVGGENDRAAWPAQRLVRGEHGNVGNADGIRIHARDGKPSRVSDICHQQRADGIRNLAEFLPVRRPRVRRVSGDDDARLVLARQVHDLVVIQSLGLWINAIRDDAVAFTRDIELGAVSEVAALK